MRLWMGLAVGAAPLAAISACQTYGEEVAPADGDASASDVAPACNTGDCKCKVNADCTDPKRRYCGPESSCVECLKAPTDTCTVGGYCNEQSQCVLGCKSVDDCKATNQKCELASHRCVDCVESRDCGDAGPAKICSPSGKCVDSCTGTGPCGSG